MAGPDISARREVTPILKPCRRLKREYLCSLMFAPAERQLRLRQIDDWGSDSRRQCFVDPALDCGEAPLGE
jgi:hypothetical protein